MRVRAALAVALALWPAIATADRCSQLRELISHAEAGFPDPSPTQISGAADCAISQDERGGKTHLCHWLFPYRDATATTAFEILDRDIRHCFKDAIALPADPAVNHPDSYQLRRYRRGPLVISASLKDKAALQQSLVFLRIDRD